MEKKVELVAWLQNPDKNWDAEDAAAQGAKGCFSEKSSADIQLEERTKEDYQERKEKIFAETSGRGHGAVLDQSCFTFSIDNLTRASTLALCAPEYAAHLQQSLRRATAERGFHLPEGIEKRAKEIMTEQFSLYDEMQSKNIPAEDARFILPLYTKTAIQTTLNARELQHLHLMSQREGVPNEVKDTITQMIKQVEVIAPRLIKDRKANYEALAWFPSSQLFTKENNTLENILKDIESHNTDRLKLINYCGAGFMKQEEIARAIEHRDEAELANLKHYHFTFCVQMSLATFHQATRQRTWNQNVQSIYKAIERGKFVTPPSIGNSEFREEYEKLNLISLDYVQSNIGNPEEVGVIPHSLIVADIAHINGWNAIYSIGKRTCTEAQWEIRAIANAMAQRIREVCPEIGRYAVPQGIIYGKCPERKSCGICDKEIKNRK